MTQVSNRKVWLSTKTFEWDLVQAGNWEWALRALALLHPVVARRLRADPSISTPEQQADAILAAIEREKGRFAQALSKEAEGLRRDDIEINVPDYIAKALAFVCERPPRPRRQR